MYPKINELQFLLTMAFYDQKNRHIPKQRQDLVFSDRLVSLSQDKFLKAYIDSTVSL